MRRSWRGGLLTVRAIDEPVHRSAGRVTPTYFSDLQMPRGVSSAVRIRWRVICQRQLCETVGTGSARPYLRGLLRENGVRPLATVIENWAPFDDLSPRRTGAAAAHVVPRRTRSGATPESRAGFLQKAGG